MLIGLYLCSENCLSCHPTSSQVTTETTVL